MGEYLLDKLWIFDAGNDVHGRTNAVGAGCTGTANIEYSFQASPSRGLLLVGPEPAPDTRLREHMLDPGSWRHGARRVPAHLSVPIPSLWTDGLYLGQPG